MRWRTLRIGSMAALVAMGAFSCGTGGLSGSSATNESGCPFKIGKIAPHDPTAEVSEQDHTFAGLYFSGGNAMLLSTRALDDDERHQLENVARKAYTRLAKFDGPFRHKTVRYSHCHLQGWGTRAMVILGKDAPAMSIDHERNRFAIHIAKPMTVERATHLLEAEGIPPSAFVVKLGGRIQAS